MKRKTVLCCFAILTGLILFGCGSGTAATTAASAGDTDAAGIIGDIPTSQEFTDEAVDGSDFDAGLACESMSDMANVMGYGTKILSSPTMALNGEKKEEYKTLLGIPEDQSAVAVLLIGHAKNGADSVSGATERNPYEDMVSTIQ